MTKLQMLLDFCSSKPEHEKRYAIARATSTCIWCGSQAQGFRDASGKLEYTCSALCQKCQDEFFSEGNL